VRVACIHGDLNLANVLVDPDARDVTLIDFGMARRDHVLHDLLRLETGVVTWLLPETLSEADLPAEIICSLYEQVHNAVRRPGHLTAPQELHPTLRKAFVILASIREMARECLFDPDNWGEYYQGLTLYLMGALKFRNLDETPEAPLPKQVAFWGAAAAQKVLREQPHYQDVVHRDIKPNNILLTHDGRPLLADFGLAKPVKGDRRLTSTGVILGTPDYMAPEQAQRADVDSRADIYALGVVLFEMLTGQHPFTGETPISVIIKHISEPIPHPSEVNSDVPPQLDAIVTQATAKMPRERYQRASDLARALRKAGGEVTEGCAQFDQVLPAAFAWR
jgi:serine/threonine protein kinase